MEQELAFEGNDVLRIVQTSGAELQLFDEEGNPRHRFAPGEFATITVTPLSKDRRGFECVFRSGGFALTFEGVAPFSKKVQFPKHLNPGSAEIDYLDFPTGEHKVFFLKDFIA